MKESGLGRDLETHSSLVCSFAFFEVLKQICLIGYNLLEIYVVYWLVN